MPENRFSENLDWISDYLSEDEFQRLCDSLTKPLDLSIRLNPLKANPEQLQVQLKQEYGMGLENVPFCPNGFWVREGGKIASRTIEHRLGFFYIQEAASMLPVELFDFSRNDKPLILDMAASPGGKTTHLASLTCDKGFIIANDASRSRIKSLEIVLAGWGVINQAVTCLPGGYFGEFLPEVFDAVLLDAPCSMQGLRSADSHKSRAITDKEINQLANRQTHLLESALRTVKTGGQVVYSTCTLTAQENEAVLAEILERFSGKVEIVDVSSKLPAPAPGLSDFNGEQLPVEIEKSLRIWPHLFNTAGFFAAKLTKTASIPAQSLSHRKDQQFRRQVHRLDSESGKGLAQFYHDIYGLDLVEMTDAFAAEMFMVKDRIYMISNRLARDFKHLPWLSAGIQIGKKMKDSWQPTHEVASRFGNQFKKGHLFLEDEHLDAWLSGGDIRGYRSEANEIGSVLLIKDTRGRILGLGKLLADRLRNLLPTRLF